MLLIGSGFMTHGLPYTDMYAGADQAAPGWSREFDAWAAEALANGAAAIVAGSHPDDRTDAPWVVVPDARLALALLAAEYHGHPSRQMQVVGITGTNGKTTTSYLINAIYEAAGIKCEIGRAHV